MTKSPAFQFYPADWLSDANVAAMSFEQKGVYITLLSHCWIEGFLRNDEAYLCNMLGIDPDQFEVIETILKNCFIERPSLSDRCAIASTEFVHPRLDKERTKQAERTAERSEAGKAGNRKRWGGNKKGRAIAKRSDSDRSAIAKRRSSSSTSVVPPKPPTGGPGDLSEIDSQSRTETQNLRDEILAEVLAILDKAGVKRKKFRGVDVVELEARAFVEAGGTPEDLEELAEFSQSKDDPSGYLASLLRGGEASWRYVLDAAKHERLRIVSKRLENGETQSYQDDQESPAAGNVADEGATA